MAHKGSNKAGKAKATRQGYKAYKATRAIITKAGQGTYKARPRFLSGHGRAITRHKARR